MRLLFWSKDGSLELTPDFHEDVPPYAILSHAWGVDDEEVTFADLPNGRADCKKGYEKIRFCGERARADGIHHFWVDTCCIDKANNSEMTEAITSMYRWYGGAQKCYVYLSDVPSIKYVALEDTDPIDRHAFRSSRWFKRGWTLQELLAPKIVEFYNKDGVLTDTKDWLTQLISEITKIPLTARKERLCQISRY